MIREILGLGLVLYLPVLNQRDESTPELGMVVTARIRYE